MRYQGVFATGLLVLMMGSAGVLNGAGQALPVKDGRPAVAAVNGESISLDELAAELGSSADSTRLRQGRGSQKDFEILDRLINVRLVVQEAATMGLDDAQEIRKQVDVTSRIILRDVLMERLVEDVKPDPVAVEKVYKDLVREWRTEALIFQDERAARRARDEIAKGGKFADVAARAVAAKDARTDGDDGYHPRKDYLAQIAEAIAGLQEGQVSPVIPIQAGFVVVTVTGIRYPENVEARAEARRRSVTERQDTLLKAHEEDLRRKYAVVDTAVLDGLDFAAAKPGLDALLEDKRIVADIKGGTPVTVGDLTDYLRMQFFHGSDETDLGNKMNSRKRAALDATLGRRLLNFEAERLGIPQTHTYRDRLRGYEDGLVFESFVQKAILPDSKMTEEEVRRYYDGHLEEYSFPEMRRLRSLVFAARDAAEEAMRKLRGGADFGWVVATAEGLVDKSDLGLQIVDGQPITTDSMPEGMQKALERSRPGDFRLYASPDGHFYVLAIQEVIASSPRPYEEVREEIAKKLYAEKVEANLGDYLGKLRAASTVEIYLKKAQ